VSNNRVDQPISVIIPDVDVFDWEAFAARVEAFSFEALIADHGFYRAFGDAGDYNPDIHPGDWLEYEEHPAQRPDFEALQAILREDVEFIRARALNPEKYTRNSESFESFGYGFSTMRVAGQLVLTGTYNEACASAGEEREEDYIHPETAVFERFLRLGLLSAPE
jgi:hypothetical protein